jgi:hypothetical protein
VGEPPFILRPDHEHCGLYGAGAEPVQGFLAGVSRYSAGFLRVGVFSPKAGSKAIEVVRVRITKIGRQAIEG